METRKIAKKLLLMTKLQNEILKMYSKEYKSFSSSKSTISNSKYKPKNVFLYDFYDSYDLYEESVNATL